MDGQTPEFLQLIGPQAVAFFRRIEALALELKETQDELRRERSRKLVKPSKAAALLDMDVDTLETIPEIRWHLPSEIRRRRVYLDSVYEYLKKYEATALQLHEFKAQSSNS